MSIWQITLPVQEIEPRGTASKDGSTIWEFPGLNDPSRFKPCRADARDWEIKKLQEKNGVPYFILKSIPRVSYLRLSESQAYLWELMDGTRSVSDLVVESFLRFHTLSIDNTLAWVEQLRNKGFLVNPPPRNVYVSVAEQLVRQSPTHKIKRLVGIILQSEFSIPGIDRFITISSKLVDWLVFSWPVQFLLLMITLIGVPAFYLVVKQGDLSFFVGGHGLLHVGLTTLVIAEILAVFVHEMAHALTTKFFGRQVRRGGVGLYFGMVAFFMDTTDIWMEGRKARMAVTWAGPYSGLILGALASITLMIHPLSVFLIHIPAFASIYHIIEPVVQHRSAWAGLMYQFANFCYAISFLNLNPLLKLDGYYILMDWLDIPMLRERSTAFVRQKLLKKVKERAGFSGEEKIFTVFGLLALAWTGIAIFSIIVLYGGNLYTWLAGMVGPLLAWVLLLGSAGSLGIYYLWRNLLASRVRSTIPNG